MIQKGRKVAGRHKKGKGHYSQSCIGRKFKSRTVKNSLESIYDTLSASSLPDGWYYSTVSNDEIQCFQITRQPASLPPLIVSRLLLIDRDLKWRVYVTDHLVSVDNEILTQYETTMTSEIIMPLIYALNNAFMCPGNVDSNIIQLANDRKGSFLSPEGQLIATLEKSMVLSVGSEKYFATVRHIQCKILVSSSTTCPVCQSYRNTLRAMASRAKRLLQHLSHGLHCNVRYLRTPQRSAYIKSLQTAIRTKHRQLKRIKAKLNHLMASNACITIDDDLTSDISKVIECTQILQGDEFKRIFWEQQVAANKAKKNGIRWHPLFIRWCLNIMLTSGKSYDILRDSGFICLPSRRTLRDYTHWLKLKPGFNSSVIDYLIMEAKIDSLADWQKFVVLAFDEMKIREDLVFDKTTGMITGFVDFGQQSLDQRFAALKEECTKNKPLSERTVATHMLTLMVRGIFFRLNFPFAQFATTGMTSNYLIYIVWRAIRLLQIAGLQVISVVADGASTNRRFFKLHSIDKYKKSGVTYLAPNVCRAPGDKVYFVADPPHLLKTIRNAWYNSQSKKARHLINNGKEIKWSQLVELMEKTNANSGLYIGRKLTREHVVLTAYSRMTVSLAAQVLSSSVANGFRTLRTLNKMDNTEETETFCSNFDKFFDICNTRSVEEGEKKRKPNLKPFYVKEDQRLEWLESTLLQYLESWKTWVYKNEEIPKEAKPYCLLPAQTIEGITICAHSLSEMIPFLLSHDKVKFVLTERFNQDPLENFFGQQRARGQRNDNPSVSQFLENTQALMVQKSLAVGGSSSIRKRKEMPDLIPSLSQPLPKRICKRSLKFT